MHRYPTQPHSHPHEQKAGPGLPSPPRFVVCSRWEPLQRTIPLPCESSQGSSNDRLYFIVYWSAYEKSPDTRLHSGWHFHLSFLPIAAVFGGAYRKETFIKVSSYSDHDYAFGQVMLTLRTTIGLTQAISISWACSCYRPARNEGQKSNEQTSSTGRN